MPPQIPMMLAEMPLHFRREPDLLSQFDDLFQDFLGKGGPLPVEYSVLNLAISHLGDAVRAGLIDKDELRAYVMRITRQHLTGTLQDEALRKQFGYSGDFQIIDHIYTRHTSAHPDRHQWDLYFHAQAAPMAVRNRKAYFVALLKAHLEGKAGSPPLSVLNVASGPGRDVREFFLDRPLADISMDCVDMDEHAIQYATRQCLPWLDRLTFHHRNVLRFVPSRGYDLVWSAGLFDYLSDKVFVHLLRALIAVTKPGGEVVIGNFSDFNPSKDYMELLGNWNLIHRSRQGLLSLAGQAGILPGKAEVRWEAQGVNLFLHIQK